LNRKLDEPEAALAAGDVQASQIFKASTSLLKSVLASQSEAIGRQIADHLYQEVLET
jgi:uncharacterized protein YaaW (UPF0174 family)